MMHTELTKWFLSGATACAIIAGCDSKPTKPLATVDFYAPGRHDADVLRQAADTKPAPATMPIKIASTKPSQAGHPTTAPIARLAPLEYMTLGGVVADVDGK